MKVYEKIGEVTKRKLYSTDKKIWFALKANAIRVGVNAKKLKESKK